MADHLAQRFGTEKDRVNCPFYIKIGCAPQNWISCPCCPAWSLTARAPAGHAVTEIDAVGTTTSPI